jgi:SPP1 gp7 family putative phage head morphogenesis protein
MKNKPRKLKPIEPKNAWSVALQRELERAIYEVIYEPLIEAEKATENARDSKLRRAIKNGDVTYDGFGFRAVKWSAALSRELKNMGARFDRKRSTWNIPRPQMPTEISDAVREATKANESLMSKFKAALDNMADNMKKRIVGMGIKEKSKPIADKTEKAFKQTVLNPIAVQPNLTPEQQIFVDQEYNQSVTRPIRLMLDNEFEDNISESLLYYTQEEVERLREMVANHVGRGAPRAELRRKVDARLGVGYNRAKFIARQETALYTSHLKQAKYRASGIKQYEWKTVGDGAVRHDHAELNRKVFSWNDPPIVDERTGRRAHPGEDFNCRCVAAPIITFGD